LIIEFDLEPGFITNRILRTSLFTRELGLKEEEYTCRLGKAFFEGYTPIETFQFGIIISKLKRKVFRRRQNEDKSKCL
jgi:ATP-dependent RNA circularization protein (DNA/RNA ligase family)